MLLMPLSKLPPPPPPDVDGTVPAEANDRAIAGAKSAECNPTVSGGKVAASTIFDQ